MAIAVACVRGRDVLQVWYT